MDSTTLIGILLFGNMLGFAIIAFWSVSMNACGLELCNPYWAYKYHTGVNWFGAILLSLLYTALCPSGALCYWFYKLCTVGRKHDND